jgi:hypothetical protein
LSQRLGACEACKSGHTSFFQLIGSIRKITTLDLFREKLVFVLRSSLRHYLYDIKHEVRHSHLHHPLPMTYYLKHPFVLQQYLVFESNFMTRNSRLWLANHQSSEQITDFDFFLERSVKILRIVRSKFLSTQKLWLRSHDPSHESFPCLVSKWDYLIDLDQYNLDTTPILADLTCKQCLKPIVIGCLLYEIEARTDVSHRIFDLDVFLMDLRRFEIHVCRAGMYCFKVSDFAKI